MIHKIIGPPGTGKTHRILDEISLSLQTYSPEKIGAVSFTNAAVEEMRNRIYQVTGERGILKHVKTLHAQCFQLLGLNKEQVAETHLTEFNEAYPKFRILSTSLREHELDSPEIAQINTQNFQAMQILRNRLIDEEEYPPPVYYLWDAWRTWMMENNYYDYTKMLEDVLLIQRYPDIDIMFVDEAQDLTKLQIKIIMKWSKNVDKTYLVGDSDQAIFRFAGSEPEIFRDIVPDQWDILEQSYRVPRAVYAKSQEIIQQIKDREEVRYLPRDEEGYVYRCSAPDLSLPGSHMIICRCNYRVKKWIEYLKQYNRIWHNPYRPEDKWWNPADTKEYVAIKSYLRFIRGDMMSIEDARQMIQQIKAKGNILPKQKEKIIKAKREEKQVDIYDIGHWGFTEEFLTLKKPLDEIFNIKSQGGQMALKLAKMNKLIDQEPVTIGTIHSIKGGEADNVWIDMLRTKKIENQMNISRAARDDEKRIEYVGVTRARNLCGILN